MVARGVQKTVPVNEVMQEVERAVDFILRDDDKNHDGYINYFEYMTGVKRYSCE